MYLRLVMVTRLIWPSRAAEFVLHNPPTETALRKWSHEHWLLAGMFGFVGTALIAIVPGFANAMRAPAADLVSSRESLALMLPMPEVKDSAAQSGWQFVRIRSGETLGVVFRQLNLPTSLMHRLLEETSARSALTHLREGQELAFELDGSGQLKTLRFDRDEKSRIDLQVAGDKITESVQTRKVEHRVEIAAGTITSSLYADGARAGLSSGAINEMANIFKYDIDFVEDVRDGDTFQVVYEELWRDGERVGTGDVIGATFTNRGKRYTAFSYDRNGKTEYFDETGRPLKKVLMRIPIEFARLSSTFGMRKHPVLGRMRAHKGVDYAARTGTPIMAAGDARVSFVGWKNGYGRAVILDHGQGRTHALRTHVGLGQGEGRPARQPGQHDRLRGGERPGHGTASSLRIPHQWQPGQSADRHHAQAATAGRSRPGPLPGCDGACGGQAGARRKEFPPRLALIAMADRELFIGLMSGTSVDGIDAALVSFSPHPRLLFARTYPLPESLGRQVLQISQSQSSIALDNLGELDTRMGKALGEAVLALLHESGIRAEVIRAVGSHGQTLRHRPFGDAPFTMQVGDGNVIAELTGIATVADFRRRDVAAGGQGAPLVPAFHAATLHTARKTARCSISAASPT